MTNKNWKRGDTLWLNTHLSDPGKGLSYGAGAVIALEDGCAGGWDVFDCTRKFGGFEFSFYGHSVRKVDPKKG